MSVSVWPDTLEFIVWSPTEWKCYKLIAHDVLEYHWMKSATNRFIHNGEGLPLLNIYDSKGSEYKYWKEIIEKDIELGYTTSNQLICLEMWSGYLRNRNRESEYWGENPSLFVACRRVELELYTRYTGPTPISDAVPSTDE